LFALSLQAPAVLFEEETGMMASSVFPQLVPLLPLLLLLLVVVSLLQQLLSSSPSSSQNSQQEKLPELLALSAKLKDGQLAKE
jgi:hypothetical protein